MNGKYSREIHSLKYKYMSAHQPNPSINSSHIIIIFADESHRSTPCTQAKSNNNNLIQKTDYSRLIFVHMYSYICNLNL